jgi:carbon storage regulator
MGMLILKRRPGESLMVGDEVEITIEGWDGGQVKVSIKAPANVAVHRREVWERIKRERETTQA